MYKIGENNFANLVCSAGYVTSSSFTLTKHFFPAPFAKA